MTIKRFCDFCGKEMNRNNESNCTMKYRHDTYCNIRGKKEHVGDTSYDITVEIDIFDAENELMDVCKVCLLEIVKQM